jgi:diguanylate cyclase (GGDEF)-like protein
MGRWILDSRVGLRMLGLFVLAAGAPVLLLAWLSQQAVDDGFARSEALVVETTAQATARQTLERLRLARQSLSTEAPDPADGRPRPSPPSPLAAVLEVAADGRRTVTFGTWPTALRDGLSADGASSRSLTLAPRAAGEPPSVVLSVSRPAGSTRFGLVDPAYLWDGVDEMPPGQWQCVFDEHRSPLVCSQPQYADVALRRLAGRDAEAGASTAVKQLFLGSDFKAGDWHFVAGVDAQGSAELRSGPVRRMLPIAAAAALVLALLLAMVQLRRTMGPLVRLTAGAREIARRRFGTQVSVRSSDEFGELADAFNEMSRRLQAQFDELGTLGEVDRRIVGRQDLQAIHATIADHLHHLLPGHAVAVARTAGQEPGHVACELRGNDGASTSTTAALLDAAAYAALTEQDGWQPLSKIVDLPGFDTGLALSLRWGDRCFGFVAIAGTRPDALDEDTLRQVREWRDRAAIAASAEDHERSLRRAARHDAVTGLLNRNGLQEELARLVSRAGPGPHTLAVLFVDLDRFKPINDTLGHAAGDQALRAAAERLRSRLPARGLAARPAGDEFVLLLPDAVGDDATALAQTVCDTLAQPMVLLETVFFLHASVGIAHCTDPSTNPEQLLRSADQAMYVAKRRGGGRYALFDAQLDAQAQRRAWIEADLPRAGERGQLLLRYQPRVERATGHMTSVEALIRWQHPERGLCPPSEFIPVAEESDLIEHIGRWVIETACSQIRVWRGKGIAQLRIAVNLSARQLASERLMTDLSVSMRRHGVQPQDLELEITEGLLLDQTEATLARLRALRGQGFTLALDDFGTGYSSMSYLRSLPIDVLKIDRAFVKDLGRDRSSMAIARAIVALASSLGLRTVAEGVEEPLQWQALAGLGCDEVQGYLVGRPMEASGIEALLAAPPPWHASGMVPIGVRALPG